MASTVEQVASLDEVPQAVAGYLDGLAPHVSGGVCWPELATLGWTEAGVAVESRPTVGHDELGITGCFCAIAETGTLVFVTGTQTPTATFLLPETHVAIVRAEQIVPGMEEAFARIRAACGELPRAVNLVSGPSRTGDIEQTIVLGAHGPRRLHIVLVMGS
jgi:L-lactate dehydrogenase complex protein LldG